MLEGYLLEGLLLEELSLEGHVTGAATFLFVCVEVDRHLVLNFAQSCF